MPTCLGRIAQRTSILGIALLLSLTDWRPCEAAYEYEMVPGRPFGVVRLTLPNRPETVRALETHHLAVEERDGRVLYPAFTSGRLQRLIADLLGAEGEPIGTVTVLFLFTGNEPLKVRVFTPEPVDLELSPKRNIPPRAHRRLLERWWRDYHLVAEEQLSEGDFSPVVSTYLTSMLGQRLQLEPPPPRLLAKKNGPSIWTPPEEVSDSLEILLGLESRRRAALQESFVNSQVYEAAANQPLPRSIAWAAETPVEFDPQAEIEPIAHKVPEDFFYVRFGRFANYIWLSNLLRDYGGDIGGMITKRGVRGAGDQRIEQQLALPPPSSALVELLADNLISDVAIVGRDLYLEDGAAIGMLFQTRNALFGTNLTQHRRKLLADNQEQGATLTTVKLAGREVTFLSTPDNRLRSFHVVDGNYHFVTTSRAMAARYLELATAATGRDEQPSRPLPENEIEARTDRNDANSVRSLADSPAFRHARTQLPLSRGDTLFAYLSPAFFRGLLSPRYQIESQRRWRSLVDQQIVELARWAGRGERLPNDETTTLVAAGLLPARYGRRPDGSQWQVTPTGMVDSLRGSRGTFLPVPDVVLRGVTRGEAAACERRAQYFERQLRQPDPIVVALRRDVLERGRERLTLDARITPLDESKYGKIFSVLGPPSREFVPPLADSAVTIQAQLKGGMFDPTVPAHHLYLALADAAPLSDLSSSGLFKMLRMVQSTPGFLGAWPKPGFLDQLPFGLGGGRPDAQGYSQLPLGLWRRQTPAGHSVLAFDRELLGAVTPRLEIGQADEDAQLRVSAVNLAETKFASWVKAISFQRARAASLGNVRLLHFLTQQLHVPAAEARDVAQRLLDAELVCSLGGQYQIEQPQNPHGTWNSAHLPAADDGRVPEDYQAPILSWFRGLEAWAKKEQDQLIVRATVQLQREPNDKSLPEPSSFFKLFGGKK
jgi:hypothetical protein